jgi:hypothetical protein
MPQMYLARFRQGPFAIASAHWALFLPESVDQNGTPVGFLFHARKQWIDLQGEQNCTVQGTANYSLETDFCLSMCPSLLDQHCLIDSNVTAEQLNDACQYISLDRKFNLVTRNCQEWVKDVIDHLVAQNVISEAVYLEMESRGYKTLIEVCKHRSSSLCTRCRR